jgi:hypothetical protein
VLEVLDPQAARSSTGSWDYDALPYYRQPDWFEVPKTTSSQRSRAASVRRGVSPSPSQEERERIVAREEVSPEGEDYRENIRGRSDDEPR